jgi:uncharacterized protein YndB with AHSA1/START domain
MKKTLQFTVFIQAPRGAVWNAMLDAESYKDWTSAFCAGSYYEGSWAEGEKIRFLSPGGDGMSAIIAANRRHEFISIRHLGQISAGVEDFTSDSVRGWAPAYENYSFADAPGGTQLHVRVETTPQFEQYMLDTFPQALRRLKALCEGGRTAG